MTTRRVLEKIWGSSRLRTKRRNRIILSSRKTTRWLIGIALVLMLVDIVLGVTAYVVTASTSIETTVPSESVPIETALITPTIPETEYIPTEVPTEIPTEPTTEPPVVESYPKNGVVNTDRLNVREEPNVNKYVIRQLPVGTEVEILEVKILDGIPWGRIADGWINLRYVDIDGEDYSVEINYNIDDLHNLALINYIEAGEDGCCNDCRRRVCDVVLNRATDSRWPGEDTIAEVLLSPYQFAQLSKTGLVWPSRASKLREQHAIERAYIIAEEVLMGNHSDVYQQGYVWYMGTNYTKDYIVCRNCGIYFSR